MDGGGAEDAVGGNEVGDRHLEDDSGTDLPLLGDVPLNDMAVFKND